MSAEKEELDGPATEIEVGKGDAREAPSPSAMSTTWPRSGAAATHPRIISPANDSVSVAGQAIVMPSLPTVPPAKSPNAAGTSASG